MDLAARWPDRVSGLVLAGATAEPSGARSLPYHALGWALSRPSEARLDAINGWDFRRRYGPAIADPIIAGGFGFRSGAPALRPPIPSRFRPRPPRYPRLTPIPNRQFHPLLPLSRPAFS